MSLAEKMNMFIELASLSMILRRPINQVLRVWVVVKKKKVSEANFVSSVL